MDLRLFPPNHQAPQKHVNDFLQLPAERQQVAYQQVAQKMGIPASYVEKDLWVCWVLAALFRQPEFAPNLTFRGGTSLTKAFGIIERFSEDIDLSVSRDWLGLPAESDPAHATTVSQAQRNQKALRSLTRQKIRDTIVPHLTTCLAELQLPSDSWHLDLNDEENTLENARDPFCVFLNYPCVTGVQQTEYIRPRVKIEFSAKAEGTPDQSATIQAFAAKQFPKSFSDRAIDLRVISPTRTFWEKAFIIHEENTAPTTRNQKPRLARHYYDLFRLIQSGHADTDPELFHQVRKHRQIYYRQTWVDYDAITPPELQIKPSTAVMLKSWQNDYRLMETMIYGDYPSLEEVIETVTNHLR